MRILFALVFLLCAAPVARAQNVFVLGEIHDNPHHHAEQAARVARIAPAALVFEMLTEAQAARVTPELIADPDTMAEALGWDRSGWPDFALYHPIFAAAPGAAIHGAALPRADARRVVAEGAAAVLHADAARFGLLEPLDPAQQARREALQRDAHCGALPEEMLPAMVLVQRARDAVLARAALDAFEATGGPVVVITGNGHARKDWGMPAALARVAPALDVHALGQAERGQVPPGPFDEIVSHEGVARPDPCDAFRQ
ncbi:ChaN family lipoprotein [Roseovarius sp. SCSIO 43702]|uniref:ChaN family lipoprotein n=1 Tax=Roseovarius sp. SCSIO 43702 TaxID=2823043 RepID=UPI001C72EF7C|nr:ChaN family lipoprotein [Roseovarius sp. SCSIO 43702]QYX57639.1 ChaN family lipoprotein [Roseovarius sp. SCSIO 43702]